MQNPHIMQQKHIQIAVSKVQLVERINKLLAASHPMSGIGGIDAELMGHFTHIA